MAADPRPALREIAHYSGRVLFRTQYLEPEGLDQDDELRRLVLEDLSVVAQAAARVSPTVRFLRPDAPWLEF